MDLSELPKPDLSELPKPALVIIFQHLTEIDDQPSRLAFTCRRLLRFYFDYHYGKYMPFIINQMSYFICGICGYRIHDKQYEKCISCDGRICMDCVSTDCPACKRCHIPEHSSCNDCAACSHTAVMHTYMDEDDYIYLCGGCLSYRQGHWDHTGNDYYDD